METISFLNILSIKHRRAFSFVGSDKTGEIQKTLYMDAKPEWPLLQVVKIG